MRDVDVCIRLCRLENSEFAQSAYPVVGFFQRLFVSFVYYVYYIYLCNIIIIYIIDIQAYLLIHICTNWNSDMTTSLKSLPLFCHFLAMYCRCLLAIFRAFDSLATLETLFPQKYTHTLTQILYEAFEVSEA